MPSGITLILWADLGADLWEELWANPGGLQKGLLVCQTEVLTFLSLVKETKKDRKKENETKKERETINENEN